MRVVRVVSFAGSACSHLNVMALTLCRSAIDDGKLDRTLVQGIDIDNNTIPSTMYAGPSVRYAFGRDEAREIFGNVNEVFAQKPRTTAQIVARARLNEFNDGRVDVLGRRRVAARAAVVSS
jgi:hypothetical protein